MITLLPHPHTSNTEGPHPHTDNTEGPHPRTDNTEGPHTHKQHRQTPPAHRQHRRTPPAHTSHQKTSPRTDNTEGPHQHTNNPEGHNPHTNNAEGPHAHANSTEGPRLPTDNTEGPRWHTNNTEERKMSQTCKPSGVENEQTELDQYQFGTKIHCTTQCYHFKCFWRCLGCSLGTHSKATRAEVVSSCSKNHPGCSKFSSKTAPRRPWHAISRIVICRNSRKLHGRGHFKLLQSRSRSWNTSSVTNLKHESGHTLETRIWSQT